MARARADRRGDAGFILLAAIWLLLLAGAIVAAMMLIALRQSREVVDATARLQAALAAESAVQLVVADLLDNGNRSQWTRTPAAGSITAGDIDVNVQVSAEAGRIDLNEADPALVVAALQGLGVPAQAREILRAEIASMRAAKRRSGHWADMARALASGGADGRCLTPFFTLWSGLPTPSPQQMPDRLAKALGQPGNMGQSGGMGDMVAGQVVRIEAVASGAAAERRLAVVRVTGRMDRPYEIYVWNNSYEQC